LYKESFSYQFCNLDYLQLIPLRSIITTGLIMFQDREPFTRAVKYTILTASIAAATRLLAEDQIDSANADNSPTTTPTPSPSLTLSREGMERGGKCVLSSINPTTGEVTYYGGPCNGENNARVLQTQTPTPLVDSGYNRATAIARSNETQIRTTAIGSPKPTDQRPNSSFRSTNNQAPERVMVAGDVSSSVSCNPNDYVFGLSVTGLQGESRFFGVEPFRFGIPPNDPGNIIGSIDNCTGSIYNSTLQMTGSFYAELNPTTNAGNKYRGIIVGLANMPGTKKLYLATEIVDNNNNAHFVRGGEIIPDYDNPNLGRINITHNGLPDQTIGNLSPSSCTTAGNLRRDMNNAVDLSRRGIYEIRGNTCVPLSGESWLRIDPSTATPTAYATATRTTPPTPIRIEGSGFGINAGNPAMEWQLLPNTQAYGILRWYQGVIGFAPNGILPPNVNSYTDPTNLSEAACYLELALRTNGILDQSNGFCTVPNTESGNHPQDLSVSSDDRNTISIRWGNPGSYRMLVLDGGFLLPIDLPSGTNSFSRVAGDGLSFYSLQQLDSNGAVIGNTRFFGFISGISTFSNSSTLAQK
jgi:hypothetical protein